MHLLHRLSALALVLGTLSACTEFDTTTSAFRADNGAGFYNRPRNRGRDD